MIFPIDIGMMGWIRKEGRIERIDMCSHAEIRSFWYESLHVIDYRNINQFNF